DLYDRRAGGGRARNRRLDRGDLRCMEFVQQRVPHAPGRPAAPAARPRRRWPRASSVDVDYDVTCLVVGRGGRDRGGLRREGGVVARPQSVVDAAVVVGEQLLSSAP